LRRCFALSEHHGGVPLAVAVALGDIHKPLDLRLGQVFTGSQVLVRGSLRGDCSFYGGWRDQLQVGFCHGIRRPRQTTVRRTSSINSVKRSFERPSVAPQVERSESPRRYLGTVVTRLCLDRMKSAKFVCFKPNTSPRSAGAWQMIVSRAKVRQESRR
jgi:hypothetical protein